MAGRSSKPAAPKRPAHPPKIGANRGRAGLGRPKGSPNKTTAAVKEAIEQVFLNIGGVEALTTWAKSNRDTFYTALLPKLLPLQINHADNEGGKLVVSWQTGG